MANRKFPSVVNIQNAFYITLVQQLNTYGEVKVPGFGVFRLKKIKEITRYVPGMKKVAKVDAHIRIKFIPNKAFKAKVQSWK